MVGRRLRGPSPQSASISRRWIASSTRRSTSRSQPAEQLRGRRLPTIAQQEAQQEANPRRGRPPRQPRARGRGGKALRSRRRACGHHGVGSRPRLVRCRGTLRWCAGRRLGGTCPCWRGRRWRRSRSRAVAGRRSTSMRSPWLPGVRMLRFGMRVRRKACASAGNSAGGLRGPWPGGEGRGAGGEGAPRAEEQQAPGVPKARQHRVVARRAKVELQLGARTLTGAAGARGAPRVAHRGQTRRRPATAAGRSSGTRPSIAENICVAAAQRPRQEHPQRASRTAATSALCAHTPRS